MTAGTLWKTRQSPLWPLNTVTVREQSDSEHTSQPQLSHHHRTRTHGNTVTKLMSSPAEWSTYFPFVLYRSELSLWSRQNPCFMSDTLPCPLWNREIRNTEKLICGRDTFSTMSGALAEDNADTKLCSTEPQRLGQKLFYVLVGTATCRNDGVLQIPLFSNVLKRLSTCMIAFLACIPRPMQPDYKGEKKVTKNPKPYK